MKRVFDSVDTPASLINIQDVNFEILPAINEMIAELIENKSKRCSKSIPSQYITRKMQAKINPAVSKNQRK